MSPRIELAPEPFVATNVSNKLLAWGDATHRRRRIAIVSGPPGIGKTESVMAFQRTYPKEVVIVKIGRKNASPTMTLRETAAAIRAMDPHDQHYWMPSGLIELRQCIPKALCSRAGIDRVAARAGQYAADAFGRLTVVVDEAQNLSREAIEMLRFWNDRDNCYAPMPIGFVFVGNNEFALRSSAHSPSIRPPWQTGRSTPRR